VPKGHPHHGRDVSPSPLCGEGLSSSPSGNHDYGNNMKWYFLYIALALPGTVLLCWLLDAIGIL